MPIIAQGQNAFRVEQESGLNAAGQRPEAKYKNSVSFRRMTLRRIAAEQLGQGKCPIW